MERIKKFLHDKLFWGFPDKVKSKDSFQSTYSCRFCKNDLAQDSAFNWFHLTDKKS